MLVGFVAAAGGASQPSSATERPDSESVEFVRGFFLALDTYDFARLDRTFSPGAKIVLANGSELDAAEYIARRRTSPHSPAPLREFSDGETISRGSMVVVGLTIRTQRREGVVHTRETWVLERKGRAFRALRAHISTIAAPSA